MREHTNRTIRSLLESRSYTEREVRRLALELPQAIEIPNVRATGTVIDDKYLIFPSILPELHPVAADRNNILREMHRYFSKLGYKTLRATREELMDIARRAPRPQMARENLTNAYARGAFWAFRED